MGYSYRSPAEVRVLFDALGNRVVEASGLTLKAIAISGPSTKREEYSGDQYVDQIEKNAIYLREGTVSAQVAIVEYLAKGKPKLKPSQVEEFLQRTRIERPQMTMPFHLNFLRNGCQGCAVHGDHAPYAAFRNLRVAGDWDKYMDEMEYSYVYFQASQMTASQFLYGLLHDHGLAGSAKRVPAGSLLDVVLERIFIWTDVCLSGVD